MNFRNPNYDYKYTIFKFFKGAGGVAISYIYLTITNGKIPGGEQITQFQTNIHLVNQIFFAVGVLTGAYHAFWNFIDHTKEEIKTDTEIKGG